MQNFTIYTEYHWSPRLAYVLNYLNNHPFASKKASFQAKPIRGASEEGIIYSAGRVGEGCWKADTYLFDSNISPASDLFIKEWQVFFKKNLFSFNNKDVNAQNLAFKDIMSEIDVLATIFYLISRYEEWTAYETDKHGRFPNQNNSLAGLEGIPIVDILVYFLLRSLAVESNQFDTKLEISHDVDYLLKFPTIKKRITRLGHTLLRQKSPSIFLKTFLQAFKKGKDPYWNFEKLLSDKKDVKKYLFVMSGGNTKGIEGHYSIKDRLVETLVGLAKERNYELGLHPSYHTFAEEDRFRHEMQVFEQTLDQKPLYNRQHFLRWQFPQTPDIIEKSGVGHDFTLGFNDRIGFRCGTSFPYQLYNFQEERPYSFIEHPLIIMDVALLRQAGYIHYDTATHSLSIERAKDIYNAFAARLRSLPCAYGLSINFHNSSFDEAAVDAPKLWQLYNTITAG